MALQELAGVSHEEIPGYEFGPYDVWMEENELHGTMVASIVAGKTLGVCKNAHVISIRRKNILRGSGSDLKVPADDEYELAVWISNLVLAMEDIAKNKRGNKSVINMSWGMPKTRIEKGGDENKQFDAKMKLWKDLLRKCTRDNLQHEFY